jgi:hypothetical protein
MLGVGLRHHEQHFAARQAVVSSRPRRNQFHDASSRVTLRDPPIAIWESRVEQQKRAAVFGYPSQQELDQGLHGIPF